MLNKIGEEPAKSNGSILFIDKLDSEVYYQIQFNDAVCSHIHLPVCDRTKETPTSISIRLAKSRTILLPAPATFPRAGIPHPQQLQRWKSNKFSLHIDGLDAACKSILTIDSVVITPTLNKRGNISSYGCSNLVVTLPIKSGKDMLEWYKSALESNNIAANTKEGILTLFDGAVVLNLSHVGIFNIRERSETNEEDAIVVAMCVGSAELV
jgi:hypothetical protein